MQSHNVPPMPPVVYVGTNGECAHCPNCKSNVMIKQRKWVKWTSLVCCCAPFALSADCSWKKQMKCLGCAHVVDV